MKRRSFTLIEIAVALPLIAILFSFLLLTLTQFSKSRYKLEEKEKKVLENHYFQRSLQKKISHVTRQKNLPEDFFHEKMLQFYFNNGMSLDPLAKGELKAKLFLENQKLKLHLFQISPQKETFVREEILLHDIDSLTINYLFEKKNYQKLPRFEIEKSFIPNKCTWVAFSLKLTMKEEEKKYFFNLRRIGI